MSTRNNGDKRAGYEATYKKALKSIDIRKELECKNLSKEWSDSKKKPKKKRCIHCNRWVCANALNVERKIITHLGVVTYYRHYYYCRDCRSGWFPRDKELGFEEEDMTDDVIELALDFVINDPLSLSSKRLELHHGIKKSATGLKLLFMRQSAPIADVEKPEPIVALPVTDNNVHQPVVVMNDGSMLRHTDGWHEAKLMSVEVLGKEDRVYLAEARDKDRFEDLLRRSPGFSELRQRRLLWIADGAPYNWNLQERLCPTASCLLDYYHAKEHVYDCARAVFGEGDECTDLFAKRSCQLLLESKSSELISQLKECYLMLSNNKREKPRKTAIEKLFIYLSNNADRLDYKKFMENGWPIGSGRIESAHKWVIQKRMKQAGMKWSPINAQRMVTMRALYASVEPSNFYSYLQKARKMAA